MKDKIIRADYDEQTKQSTVTLLTSWGVFEHTVKPDAEDWDIANRFDGCRFAHYLCIADKLRAKGKAFLERSNGMNIAANVLASQLPDDVTPSKIRTNCIGAVRDQAYYAERDGRAYLEQSRNMRENYMEFVKRILKQRQSIRDKFEVKEN